MRIDSNDSDCRYLSAPGGGLDHGFGRLCRELKIRLPDGLDLAQLVRLGWMQPVLRVKLPERMFLSWTNYPIQPGEGEIAEEDGWALKLYLRCAFPSIPWRWRTHFVGNWFRHFLDDSTDELGQEAWSHRIPAGPGAAEPASFRHPRGNYLVRPWIDFFRYWQVYELAGVLRAARLSGPLLNGPGARGEVENLLARLSELRTASTSQIARQQAYWAELGETFEWISHFRTMLGIFYSQPTESRDLLREAAPRLLAELGVTADRLKQNIRDVLLVEWWRRRLSSDDESNWGLLAPLRKLFQEDVLRAVQFLEEAAGREADLEEAFWAIPEDRQSRGWEPLAEVLPYEGLGARRTFPNRALWYMRELGSTLGGLVSEDRLKALVMFGWRESVAFRRFCVAFWRLHEELSHSEDDRIGLRARLPMEFMILCSLHAEKIVRDRFLFNHTDSSMQGVTAMFARVLDEVLTWQGAAESDSGVREFKRLVRERGQLHDLHRSAANPFIEESEIAWTGELSLRIIVTYFVNLVILRNYAAHHDALDQEMIYTPMAQTALKALLVPTVTVMELARGGAG